MSEAKTAVVTGGGSGVGQAVVLRLLEEGWNVGVIGRRKEALDETAEKAGDVGQRLMLCAGDISIEEHVEALRDEVVSAFGKVHAVVNSAGINVKNRRFEVLSREDYENVIGVNLTGAFNCVQAFLPGMREMGEGTIVNIVSEAGKIANGKAGAPYIMSKFGMDGLTQAINMEEREGGIRACSIYPGDINTPILDKRPSPPPADVRTKMIQPEDIADCVMLVINLPGRTTVEEMMVRPTVFTT